MSTVDPSVLVEHEDVLQEKEYLLKQKKLALARKNFIHFCQYVIKDESSGNKIKLAELQKTWIRHIAFCKRHGLNALILAPMSSGKCVTKSTVIKTVDGDVTAGDLYEDFKNGDKTKVLAYNEDTKEPVWSSIKEMTTGVKPCVFLKFESGRNITTTLDHPFLDENFEWVEAQDLRPNKDKVLLFGEYDNLEPLQSFTGNEAYIFGVFYGKFIKKSYEHTFEDLAIVGAWFDANQQDFDAAKYKKDKEYAQFKIFQFYNIVYGRTKVGAEDILEFLRYHDRKVASKFIAGLFDACGNYDSRNKQIVIPCNSYNNANLQSLLLYCGFNSKRVRRPITKDYYLHLDKDKNIGFFNLPINSQRLAAKVKFDKKDGSNKFVKDKLISAEVVGVEQIVSIEVEDTHTFVANDFITHNTQIISVAMPLYTLGKNPASRILLICLSDEAAKERVTSIKSYIESDPDYHEVFPHIVPGAKQEWTKHKLFIERDTYAKDASINSNGITSSSIIGARCDLLLVDDIFDQRTAVSQPQTREQYITTYRQVCLSRVEPQGSVIAICTRWHEADLAGHIMQDAGMMRRYGVLIQRVADDFSGLECEVHVPDKLQFLYQKECGEFFTIRKGF